MPKKIREAIEWLGENSVVAFWVFSKEEIRVIPYRGPKSAVDWRELWKKIQLARSIKGKQGNLSEFIVRDRSSH